MIIRVFTILGAVFFVVGLAVTVGLGLLASYLFNSPGNDFYQFHLVLIFPGIGMIFLVLGIIFLMVAMRKRRLRNWLFENGKPVWARVQGIESQTNAGGGYGEFIMHSTVLVATYENMRFVSDQVRHPNRLMSQLGEHVKVLIHPDNPDRYIFDFANESPLRPAEQPK